MPEPVSAFQGERVNIDALMQRPILTVVAAMNCEVKPIVDTLGLRKRCDKPFTVFSGEFNAQAVEVLVSGIGALAMATAVGWMGGQHPLAKRVWLNVGTAGHGTTELGSAFRVHASADILSERKIRPALVAKSVFATDEVLSVNAPSTDYPDIGGIDMEAYAFFASAHKFSSAELVESIKVVSDNPGHDIEGLNAAKISELIRPHVQELLKMGSALLGLLPPSLEQTNFKLPELRATHSQRQQANALVAKLNALNALDSDLVGAVNKVSTIKELLTVLNIALLAIEPQIEAVRHG